MRLKNKACVVTGAASGIGRATAIRFAQEGAAVALIDRQAESRLAEEVPATVDVIRSSGGKAWQLIADVSDAESVDRAISEAENELGQIDILVNSAGVFIRNRITDVSEEEWDRVLDVNLKGYFLTCRRVIPGMLRQGHGSIVNISSIHGFLGTGNAATYCASKGGVTNLTRQLAVDYAAEGIRVNAVAPGCVATAMSKPFRETKEIMAEYKARTLMGRLGTPEDVASAALYLASDEASWVTGHCLVVDGGWTIA
jgi:glucose 1-dehydrogenase